MYELLCRVSFSLPRFRFYTEENLAGISIALNPRPHDYI